MKRYQFAYPNSYRALTLALLFVLTLGLASRAFASGVGAGATATITLTAYSGDGTNTGTARLGGRVHIVPSISGTTNTSVVWTLTSGAGSVTTDGYYYSPTTMPSNTAVTVTCTLASDSTVSASYSLNIINAVPALSSIYPNPLSVGGTNTVTINGSGFVPGTVIYVNGSAVTSTYSSFGTVTAQVPISGTASGSASISAVNPTPGGGTSNTVSQPIVTPTMILTEYSGDGTNTATVRLGNHSKLVPTITGSLNSAVTFAVTSGVGTVGTDGTYQAPNTMPSNTSVTVKATLTANPAITASYTMNIINAVPTIYSASPNTLSVGGTNTVTINGAGFVPGTVIYANGTAVTATYSSYSSMTAQIPVSGTATGSVSLTAVNPTPGGGTSSALSVSIAKPTITLTEYSGDGTNTATVRLGNHSKLVPTVTGSLNTNVTFAITSGVGTIGTDGTYQAPNTMPSNTAVTVTATLVANTSITGSYTMNIVNAVPSINSVYPNPLSVGGTNSVNINGSGFVPGTVVYVNGSAVSTSYQSFNLVTAQVPVAGTATGSLSVSTINPAPGGGTSNVVSDPISTPAITLAAYNGDGTNTGTTRLGNRTKIVPSVTGSLDSSVTYTLTSGAGSVTTDGYYYAPTTMPSSTAVTVTVALVQNPAITATYNMNIINAVPAISSVYPNPLQVAGTNSVSINGSGFVPGTIVYVNGAAVTAAYSSFNLITAQVPVSGTATGSLTISTVNPAPGGGTSNAVSQPIATPTITLNAFNGDGTNTGTTRLGSRTKLVPNVAGSLDSTVNWSVTSGVGSMTTDGYYMAPQTMPANPSVTVTGTLNANSSITASYTFQLINPVPYISGTYPTQLTTNVTNSVNIFGTNFVPGTQVYVNGTAVPTTYTNFNQITATIAVPDNGVGSYVITAVAPTPGGGSSTTYSLPILVKTTQLNAYSTDGVNPTTIRLGRNMQFYLSITNGTGDTTATWTVNGGGTVSSNGLYQAPTAMPSSTSVTVTAALVSNPAVTATYQFSLLNPTPVISASNPASLKPGAANTVTLAGSGFVAGTTILVNGAATSTTFQSADSVQVQITPSSSATSVSITAQNPNPGASSSSTFVIPVGNGSTVSATIGTTAGQKIPLNFLGFSHEWGDSEWNMGTNATGVNTIYRQLIKNLMNGATYPFFIRIGGNSTDSSGEPTATTVPAFADLANAMGVHFSLGVNMGQNNVQLAVDQATAYASQMPAGYLDVIEIGNEPDNYGYTGMRSNPYSFTSYQSDFATWRSNVLPVLGSTTKLMGPAWGDTKNLINLSTFQGVEAANVSLVSQHFYAGHQYGGTTFAPDFLLTPSASTQAATAVAPYVASTHQKGELFRIAEMNSIDGGGITGISDAFGSALWSIDSMFELANVGVDGVNFHGISGCNYCAFTFGKASVGSQSMFTLQEVNPLYYGMLFFQWATGNNSKILPVTLGTTSANIKVWATVDQNSVIHVAILNKDESFAGNVAVNLPGHGDAQVVRLLAPSYQSSTGLSIGGQTFDGSIDGTLVGSPDNETASATSGVYTIAVQPTSAVLLTIK